MVFDVPAVFGGALTILNQYHDMARRDKDNEWLFIVSKPRLSETENLKVVRFPWVKKSWFHRLFFDKIYAFKLVKKYKPDKIISLQSIAVRAPGYFQELYIHQALPFCEERFSFFKNNKLWIYQNIISKFIVRSARIADSVVVQSDWMKDALCKKSNIPANKVNIVCPTVNIHDNVKYEKGSENLFFYPASSAAYKNHNIIYKAVRILKKSGYKNFKIVLTINKSNDFSNDYRDIEDLIEFCGYLNRSQVANYYSKSVLLFPSYLESFGLPLLEARLCGCPIIASDCNFAREILDGYEKADFFSPFAENELFKLLKKHIY